MDEEEEFDETMSEPIILATPEERERERLADTDYADTTITEWMRMKSGRADITTVDSYGLSPIWPDSAPDAKVGDKIRIYGTFGYPLAGVALWQDGKLVPISYRTKSEEAADFKVWQDNYRESKHKYFEKNKAKMDEAYEALPLPLKRRIDRFRSENPEFRWDGEPYEMASCSEAGRLYKRALDPEFGKTLKSLGIKMLKPGLDKREYEWKPEDGTVNWEDTPENRLMAFDAINSNLNGYNYKLMHELMPEMDEGHSGNTWDHAVMFARLLIRDGDEAKL